MCQLLFVSFLSLPFKILKWLKISCDSIIKRPHKKLILESSRDPKGRDLSNFGRNYVQLGHSPQCSMTPKWTNFHFKIWIFQTFWPFAKFNGICLLICPLSYQITFVMDTLLHRRENNTGQTLEDFFYVICIFYLWDKNKQSTWNMKI